MYIKQMIIQGFKSYKDQTVIEPFSPKLNVIVGRNGSGKSNFFAAIQFVLSDKYVMMGREERQALLHEGSGAAMMSAYVEVIFDNSDGRFPTDTDEVILRRTIGQKKDEYSLNRKNTTRNEVMNMLETAGFSRTNPYYIVPQGRITAITNMGDAKRLELLKDIAGTNVYEQRRAESRRIMDETEHKRAKIDELLEHIRGRLEDLEEEKEELRAFQESDRERRCLEYTIHQKDQAALTEALQALDSQREDGVEQNDADREALQTCQDELETIDGEIQKFQANIKLLQEERAQLEDERTLVSKQKAKAELDLQNLISNQKSTEKMQAQRMRDQKEVEGRISEVEEELTQLLPGYNAKKGEERELKQRLQDDEAARSRLYAKQSRHSQFRSKKERDAFLKEQMADTKASLATRQEIVSQSSADVERLEKQIGELERNISEMRSRIENRGGQQEDIQRQATFAKETRARLEDERRELWREEARLDSALETARNEVEKAQRITSRQMDQSTSKGLENVRRFVMRNNVQGAYGVLGELFEVEERLKTAAEVTAGTSLYHYVVDNDDTATLILEALKKEGGRVTFVPLNRVKVRTVNMPKAQDAVHLVSKLTYDPKFEKAMQQVFGQTVICPNLQVAAQYARSHQISAITMEGDRSDKKGALTGGFYDVRSSRISGLKRLVQTRETFETLNRRKQEIQTQLERLNQEVTKAMSDGQKAEQKRMQLETGYGPLREELRRREAELHSKQDELEQKRRAKENVEAMTRSLQEQIVGYEAELNSAFERALSAEEEQSLDSLNARIPDLQKQCNQASRQRSELEQQKQTLEIELRENLQPRLDQLLTLSDASGASITSVQITSQRELVSQTNSTLLHLQAKLTTNETTTEDALTQLTTTQTTREATLHQIETLTHSIRAHQKSLEKGAQKRSAINSRLHEVSTQIRSLGVLPDAAFLPPYTTMTSSTATSRLHTIQQTLKQYGHVNKKAIEQFTQFERQRETLLSRRSELDTSDSSIRELITVLDTRKDEAIDRTFRQVSREFSSIFSRLVPAGRGSLIIQRRTDNPSSSSSIENYTGVSISVSFTPSHEPQRIQQLSGGQKSLCALALVFALQATDPAPFYLFDEIDANLDSQYRAAVAAVLKGSQAQFICTTFRPEMVQVADRCYGVSYRRKESRIDLVGRGDALGFVEGQI
ncbi:putative chromosome segregation protein SudA [Piedraia hortae CBS 480.64]|uniref:Structural maintenance of chromosomes protein n=1 Tax=Piedraia hortae CBS 480.64 TaxID=1314780 RepID=A0A6A7BU29_9PEZI|nr:putative chromosome segregation protein SudA [Piedraia hortae CBS 480.64]